MALLELDLANTMALDALINPMFFLWIKFIFGLLSPIVCAHFKFIYFFTDHFQDIS